MFAKGISVLFTLDAIGIRIFHRAPHSSRAEHNISGDNLFPAYILQKPCLGIP
jgi:hypothetical protein